jgi:hypothetical protein
MASWHRLLGWFQICLVVLSRHGAGKDGLIPAVFWEENLLATNSSSLLMSELFLQRRAEDDLIGTFRICND